MRIAEPEIVGDEPRKQRRAGNELEILHTAFTKLEVSQIHILPRSDSRSKDVFRQSVSSVLRSHWKCVAFLLRPQTLVQSIVVTQFGRFSIDGKGSMPMRSGVAQRG
jgi:hypothetical protein